MFFIVLFSILISGLESFSWQPYLFVVFAGLILFKINAFAGGDIKLVWAYLLGIDQQWWSVVFLLITGLGGVMAVGYLAYGYFTKNLEAVRKRGLPYGVPIAIGGCLGVWLSSV
ncbi:hypothetical protein M3P05_16150 [Sansalvadorimonas sp. 2012CJ34-2]|uniref:Prepilin type IV endopeptidase peptidase domain-containing protein n=1 Tax=Parendozoicomonas callyspongiae TaxID=2942213 RepID=A0ABT0PJC9_9GAMM|nr:hypothetical protein [Sansalvadorimonas sp. 2012CJ34-2]MCL6271454.1 hypothetical protein [Sansalvadorimonas sp. 2012CJ34-2]